MMVDTKLSGLYDGAVAPIGGADMAWELIAPLRPRCAMLFDADRPPPEAVDLIVVLPANSDLIPASWLAQAVTTLDRGEAVAVHGISADQVQRFFANIMALAGGARA